MHLDLETVQFATAGQLTSAARAGVYRHAADCAECRRLLAEAAPDATPEEDAAAPATWPTIPFERYEVSEEVGRGGLGRVMRAHHVALARTVAIKELLHRDRRHELRFLREAQITATLQHPGVVPVLDAGRWPTGEPFYATKLVTGKTLHELLAAPELRDRLALLPSLIAVGETLAYAHACGVVHRDVKPSNILIGEFGETVLIDWGLARRDAGDDLAGDPRTPAGGSDEDELTRDGDVIGTPRYMSPEQARGEPVDARADVYSLGVILHELLAGDELPSIGDSAAAGPSDDGLIAQIARSAPDAPRELVAIAARALARDPAARYPSAGSFVDDLKRFATGQLVSVRRYSGWELVMRRLRRHRLVAAVAAAAVVALAIAISLAALRIDRAREVAESSVARLELDQGRLAFLSDDPLRAIAYLTAALRDGADVPVTRFLVARAAEALDHRRLELPAHPGGVLSARFGAGGARIVTSGSDETVGLWDSSSGALLHRLRGHRGAVFAAAMSPSGDLVASGGLDGDVRLWDGATGAGAGILGGHRGYVSGLSFSTEGDRLLSWDLTGGLRLWDLASRRPLFAIQAHTTRLTAAVLSHDGAFAVSAAWADPEAQIWNLPAGTRRCGVRVRGESVAMIAVSDGDRAIAVAEPGGWTGLHDARTCAELRRLRTNVGAVTVVQFDRTGRRLLVAGLAGAQVWDATTGELTAVLHVRGGVTVASFSPDGERIALGGHDGLVSIVSARDGYRHHLLAGHDVHLRAIAWSPAGDALLSGAVDGVVRVWDGPDRRIAPPVSGPLRFIWAEADGVTAIRENGDAFHWSTAARQWRLVARELCPPHDLRKRVKSRCQPAGDGVLLRTTGDATVEVVGADGAVISRSPVAAMLAAIAPGGRLAASVSAGGAISIWDTRTGHVVREIATHARLRALAFHGDQRLISLEPRRIVIWDVATAARLFEIPTTGDNQAYAYVETHAGRDLIVTPGTERGAELRRAGTGALVATLNGQRGPIWRARFSPDGDLIVTQSGDGQFSVWDTVTGVLLQTIEPGVDANFDIARDRDGTPALLTADDAGELQHWSLGRGRRSIPAITSALAACVPYQVRGGTIHYRELPPAACATSP